MNDHDKLLALEIALEHEIKTRIALEKKLNNRFKPLEEFMVSFRSLATRWGFFLAGALSLGTILMMGIDRAKDKLIDWFLP